MGIENARLSKDYAKGSCQECYIQRTCTDSIKGQLCKEFGLLTDKKYIGDNSADMKRKTILEYYRYTTKEEQEIDEEYRNILSKNI